MERHSSFAHESLDQSLSQIRLISVTPEAGGPVRCTIKHINLDADRTPDYRALSYTWGPPGHNRQIVINNELLSIRQNLHDFLVAFRKRLWLFRGGDLYEDELQWLWIDQICIDQAIVEERNHQVRMMARIYQQATYVYVWLGSSDTRTEAAMKTLKTAFRRYHDDRYEASATRRKISGVKEKAFELAPRISADSADALRQFFHNSYWTRLWIVQEVMLARYIRIICGESLLSWEELRRFCMSDLTSLPGTLSVKVPTQTKWLAGHALSARSYGLHELLAAFWDSQCEDPRDMVYGLQGLLAQEQKIPIEYGKPVEEVFLDAAFILCATAQDHGSTGSAKIYKKIDLCDSVASIHNNISHSLIDLRNDIRRTQTSFFFASRDAQHRAFAHSDQQLQSQVAYRKHAQDSDSELRDSLEKALGERGLPDQWVSRSIDFVAMNMETIARSHTRHLKSDLWVLDFFIPRNFSFHQTPWCASVSVQNDRTAEYQYELVRNQAWTLNDSDSIELEVLFTATESFGTLVELQVVLKEAASDQLSLMLSIKTGLRTVKFFEAKTRYLCCRLDMNARCNIQDSNRATCIILRRPYFVQPLVSQQTPECVLKEHLGDTVFVNIGDERETDVYTHRSKQDALISLERRERLKSVASSGSANECLEGEEASKIAAEHEVIFRRFVAVGYSQRGRELH